MKDNKIFFTRKLLQWNSNENNREMPWKHEKDPYKIWISEIILQQTRVQQGWEYYKRFIKKYPTVKILAAAPDNEVFKLWEGLGYYSRCRNIIISARFISETLNGKFPVAYDDILELKGIGSYTASAIASFAYNLPHAVLDGNVFRVLSRYFGSKIPIDTTEGRKTYAHLAGELLDKKDPGIYNQSIMDFGATICKPLPLCEICPLKAKCVAYRKGWVLQLPVKEKTIAIKKRWFYYLVAEYNKKLYVRKRMGKDIWQNLYEFILVESPKSLTPGKLQLPEKLTPIIKAGQYTVKNVSGLHTQKLTHQLIEGRFVRILLKYPVAIKEYKPVSLQELQKLPLPKFINTFLKD